MFKYVSDLDSAFEINLKVSLSGSIEFTEKTQTKNELIRNILSVNGVSGIFLSDDFLSVSKEQTKDWEDIKHIIILIKAKNLINLMHLICGIYL